MSCAAVARAQARLAGIPERVVNRSTAIPIDDPQSNTLVLSDTRRAENRAPIPETLEQTAAQFGIAIPPSTCVTRRERNRVIRELVTLQKAAVHSRQYPTVRTPSRFVAVNPRQQAALNVSEGWSRELADVQQRYRHSIHTKGLNGEGSDLGGVRTFGNLAFCVRNDNATKLNPRSPGRTPSKFTANTAAEMATLQVERGWTKELADVQQHDRFAIRTRGLGGEHSGGQRVFGNQCVKVSFWGVD